MIKEYLLFRKYLLNGNIDFMIDEVVSEVDKGVNDEHRLIKDSSLDTLQKEIINEKEEINRRMAVIRYFQSLAPAIVPGFFPLETPLAILTDISVVGKIKRKKELEHEEQLYLKICKCQQVLDRFIRENKNSSEKRRDYLESLKMIVSTLKEYLYEGMEKIM